MIANYFNGTPVLAIVQSVMCKMSLGDMMILGYSAGSSTTVSRSKCREWRFGNPPVSIELSILVHHSEFLDIVDWENELDCVVPRIRRMPSGLHVYGELRLCLALLDRWRYLEAFEPIFGIWSNLYR